MLYALLGLIAFVSIGFGLYGFLGRRELDDQVAALEQSLQDLEAEHRDVVAALRGELARFDRIKDVPDIIERAKKTKAEVAARLEAARVRADEIILAGDEESERLVEAASARLVEAQDRAGQVIAVAMQQAHRDRDAILGDTRAALEAAKQAEGLAHRRAQKVLEEAGEKAKKIASEARKEAKEKTGKVDETLRLASAYALEIRRKAERRAQEIGGKGFQALGKAESYEATARAMKNAVDGYEGVYLVPSSHILDELADEFGFHKAGERLKLARQRSGLMVEADEAATCDYPVGWKRDYAIKFVLSAFDGKVDATLAKVKPANQGRLIQEIKDAYALTNHNGSVFKDARIQEEYLDARLDELKWAVAVQKVKETQREEQRAIRDRMREEEKARKEFERAIKQTQKVEEEIGKALERTRREYEQAGDEERTKYEAKLRELQAKLAEAEEKNQKAISMAQQTKCGHVYVISNVGSFGEDVYKIGLTRRLEPLERVRELGDASVPFPFDVHAMIYSDEAPALETALHKRFLDLQVNKANKRKEFFRVRLGDIRRAVEEMGLDARWTLAAEAREYRETLALEQAMAADPDIRKRWEEEQASSEYQPQDEEMLEEVEALAEES